MISCGESKIELLEAIVARLADRPLPRQARPGHPPPLLRFGRPAPRRPDAARRGCRASPAGADTGCRRLLGAVRPSEERRRRSRRALAGGRRRDHPARGAGARSSGESDREVLGRARASGDRRGDLPRHQPRQLRGVGDGARPPRAFRVSVWRRCSCRSFASNGSSSTRRSARWRAIAAASNAGSAPASRSSFALPARRTTREDPEPPEPSDSGSVCLELDVLDEVGRQVDAPGDDVRGLFGRQMESTAAAARRAVTDQFEPFHLAGKLLAGLDQRAGARLDRAKDLRLRRGLEHQARLAAASLPAALRGW